MSSGEFEDTGSGTDHNITVPTNYIDNSYGAHLAYNKMSITSADIFNDETMTIYGQFFTQLSTSFYLFCEQNGATDRLCLSVNPSGYYQVTMTNSQGTTETKTVTFMAETGYNFFALQMEPSFGYTEVTVRVSHENYGSTTNSETLSFTGSYEKSTQTFNIGCKVVNSACTNSFLGSFIALTINDTKVADATLDGMIETTCTDDGLLTCGLCADDSGTGKCLEVFETTPKTKYLDLDITSTTTASTTVSDLSGDSHTFNVSSTYPYRIPKQGYKFGTDMSLDAQAGFALPNSFTINTWFRMDTTETQSDYIMQYLFLKQDSGTDKFYIGLTNSYLRVFIDGMTYDYYTNLSTSSSWRYLSISIYQVDSLSTGVQIFLDSTKMSEQVLYTTYTDSATYDIIVGLNLAGNIYSLEISPLLNNMYTTPPMLITASCTDFGSTSCTVCPRTGTAAGVCLSECGLGTFDENCSACDWTCGYCSATGSNCITCADELEGTGAAPRTCTCRAGYFTDTSACTACDSLCGTCTASGSTDCETCANSAYKVLGSDECVST